MHALPRVWRVLNKREVATCWKSEGIFEIWTWFELESSDQALHASDSSIAVAGRYQFQYGLNWGHGTHQYWGCNFGWWKAEIPTCIGESEASEPSIAPSELSLSSSESSSSEMDLSTAWPLLLMIWTSSTSLPDSSAFSKSGLTSNAIIEAFLLKPLE